MWKFLESEKLVIFGLIENAHRTDGEIAETFGLKKGTVSSIRKRLLEAGAISFVNVPSFNRLGCEMLAAHVGTMDPAMASETKAGHYIDFCKKCPQIFESVMGGGSIVMYSALRNATELEELIQAHNNHFLGYRRSSKAKLTSYMFPFALSKMAFVPNFAKTIHDFFGLNVRVPKPQSLSSLKVSEPDLSVTERETLVALVENPRASDRMVSEVVGLSRQAVTRIRNNLYEDGLLTLACVPEFCKWGFEIYALAIPKFNMEIPWEKRMKSEPRASLDKSFLTLSKPDEAIANYVIGKFSDYTQQLEEILAWYHKVGAFEEKPDITLFSLERCTELRDFEYGPAVRELLLGKIGGPSRRGRGNR